MNKKLQDLKTRVQWAIDQHSDRGAIATVSQGGEVFILIRGGAHGLSDDPQQSVEILANAMVSATECLGLAIAQGKEMGMSKDEIDNLIKGLLETAELAAQEIITEGEQS